jgi:hypothetical protein
MAVTAIAIGYQCADKFQPATTPAKLAPAHSMKHVWVLAALGQMGGIAGVVAGWNLSAHWYPLAIAVTAIPTVWLGGYLATKSKISQA